MIVEAVENGIPGAGWLLRSNGSGVLSLDHYVHYGVAIACTGAEVCVVAGVPITGLWPNLDYDTLACVRGGPTCAAIIHTTYGKTSAIGFVSAR
jgi:hypothetical protein